MSGGETKIGDLLAGGEHVLTPKQLVADRRQRKGDCHMAYCTRKAIKIRHQNEVQQKALRRAFIDQWFDATDPVVSAQQWLAQTHPQLEAS